MRRNKKSKMTMLVVGGLAAVSLVSVGFANWVITDANPANQGVTVNVGTVQNDSLTVSVDTKTESGYDDRLSFDNVETPNEGAYLSNTGTTSPEDLKFVLPVEVSGKISLLNKITFAFSGNIAESTVFSGSGATEYLLAPWGTTDKLTTYTYASGDGNNGSMTFSTDGRNKVEKISESDNLLKLKFTFTFKWGAAFSETNPGNVTSSTLPSISKDDLLSRVQLFGEAIKGRTTLNCVITPSKN